MKQIILSAMLLILANSAFSQQNNPSPVLTKQDLLKKSKHQKTTAFIFLGAGTGLITTAVIIEPFYNFKKVGSTLMMPPPDYTYKTIFFLTGLASMVASIPFVINSSKNKKKAAGVSFRMEKVPVVQQQSLVYHSYPAFSLKN